MQMTATVVTEFFMMVLCVAAAPVDQQEIRVDVVGDRGYMDTLVFRRTDTGFTVHDEMNGQWVQGATIEAKEGAKNIFVVTDQRGKSETIDLAGGIQMANLSELKTKVRIRLKTVDGINIALDRSKGVVFVTPDNLKRTYVVH